MDERIRILFLAADPSNLTRTRLANEYQVIRDELNRGESARRFVLETVFSVKIPDMTRAVKNFRPHIIHFSGHGSVDGELCFEDLEAKAKRVKVEDLEGIFALLAGQVDCVVLNACYSEKQAAMISSHIPYVVGMKEVVTDQAAICIALGFYQSLSAGGNIEAAFEDACALLIAEGLSGSVNEPVIKVGPGAGKLLAGPWGDRVGSETSGPLTAARGAPGSRDKAEAGSSNRQRWSRATVKGRNIHAGRDILMKASPGTVDADGLKADRDVRLEGSVLEKS